MPFARSNVAAAQTDTSLVAAPGADKQIIVDMVAVSSAVANDITFESDGGTDQVVWREFLAANDGRSHDTSDGLFRCRVNEALIYTSTGAGNTFVAVRYRIARATGQ